MLEGENYCITAKNLLCHEFIGLPVRVESSTDKNKAKISGTIIDETKNRNGRRQRRFHDS